MFEIGQAEDDVGKFEVSAKFLGVNMEKVTIVLQVRYERGLACAQKAYVKDQSLVSFGKSSFQCNCYIISQDLLQLQYEGVSVMKMFDGRALINVNLLIFLLNKKFYGK